jgi:hypothetical protein
MCPAASDRRSACRRRIRRGSAARDSNAKSPRVTLDIGNRMSQGQLNMYDPVSYRRIHGSCHCGNIRVIFDRPDSGPIPVRACGCGLCTKHRAAWTSHPDGRFYLRVADHSRVTRYRFGTKTADFHVCVTCGVIPIVTCVIQGIRYAVFNVNTFEDVDRSQLVETATNFEGETTENRLARRRRNWTPEAIRGEGGD